MFRLSDPSAQSIELKFAFCQSPVLHSDPSQKPEIGYAILHRPNLVLAFNTVSRQTAVTQHSDSIRCPQATAARAAARPAGPSTLDRILSSNNTELYGVLLIKVFDAAGLLAILCLIVSS